MELGQAVLDLLFPPSCPFCGRLVEERGEPVCGHCRAALPWTRGDQGEVAGEFFSLCAAPLWYRDQVRQCVHQYKFSGHRAYARPCGQLMARCVQDHLEGRYDVVTWVPLSRKRRRERGYDQARLLAGSMARALGCQTVPLLEKIRHTQAQSGLEEESQRRANVLGAYRLLPRAQVSGTRVLLVDDVVTTGSTLSECARVLRSAGADDVVCAALARARE